MQNIIALFLFFFLHFTYHDPDINKASFVLMNKTREQGFIDFSTLSWRERKPLGETRILKKRKMKRVLLTFCFLLLMAATNSIFWSKRRRRRSPPLCSAEEAEAQQLGFLFTSVPHERHTGTNAATDTGRVLRWHLSCNRDNCRNGGSPHSCGCTEL